MPRVKFNATTSMPVFQSREIELIRDGEAREFDEGTAQWLFETWPDNFALVTDAKSYHAPENKVLTPTNVKAKRR